MPEVEVLVSDRHGLDDTLEQLRQRHAADSRFRFFAATDAIDWVAHYNWLLARGRGTYFAWMPHDDTFPAGWYSGLVEHLDRRPDTLLAFGPLIAIDLENRELPASAVHCRPPPWDSPERWSARDAYRMLRGEAWVPFRGVFRREPIVAAGLFMRSTYCNQSADKGWLFAVGLLGAVRFVAVPPCYKRYYPGSTHRRMPASFRSRSSLYPVLIRYVLRHSPSARAALVGIARVAGTYLRRVVVPRMKQRLCPGARRSAATVVG